MADGEPGGGSRATLEAIRTAIARACRRLESPSPQSLDECALDFERAVAHFADIKTVEDGKRNELIVVALEVRRELFRARRLLGSAHDFHRDWGTRMGAMVGGYRSDGQAEPVTYGSRRSLSG